MQDDFVAWMGDGRVSVTEHGCFAKTFNINPDDEPAIYGAVTQPRSYLENVSQTGDEVDFYDTSYTKNGRATWYSSFLNWCRRKSSCSTSAGRIRNRRQSGEATTRLGLSCSSRSACRR